MATHRARIKQLQNEIRNLQAEVQHKHAEVQKAKDILQRHRCELREKREQMQAKNAEMRLARKELKKQNHTSVSATQEEHSTTIVISDGNDVIKTDSDPEEEEDEWRFGVRGFFQRLMHVLLQIIKMHPAFGPDWSAFKRIRLFAKPEFLPRIGKILFRLLDQDGTGFVTLRGVQHVFGEDIKKSLANEAKVTEDELLNLISRAPSVIETLAETFCEKAANILFRIIDDDGDGFISTRDVGNVFGTSEWYSRVVDKLNHDPETGKENESLIDAVRLTLEQFRKVVSQAMEDQDNICEQISKCATGLEKHWGKSTLPLWASSLLCCDDAHERIERDIAILEQMVDDISANLADENIRLWLGRYKEEESWMSTTNLTWKRRHINKFGPQLCVLEPTGEHEYTLIYLHGFTNSPFDYVKTPHFFYDDRLFPCSSLRVVLPGLPVRPFTGNAERQITGETTMWYDCSTNNETDGITEPDQPVMEGTTGLLYSRECIHKVIDEELKLVGNPKRIFLGGNSQGCCCGLDCILTYRETLGGYVGTIGHLLEATPVDSAKKDMPIWMYNCKEDETMVWDFVEPSSQRLKGGDRDDADA